MTPDMAFECLIVSRDPEVVCTLNHVLDNLSIRTNLCLTPDGALNVLQQGNTDLVVIDWEDDHSAAELLRQIQKCDVVHKQTVVAVSSNDRRIPGAHLVLTKPVTAETGADSIKTVYSRMVQDHRRHARYAVMTPVLATDRKNRLVPITVTNIGDGGIGLSAREQLTVGDVLSFRILLPDANKAICVEARVLWTREYGTAGCEFVRIPPADVDVLHAWLKAKCQLKKPLVRF